MEYGDLIAECMSENYLGNEGIHQRPENYIEEVLADHWANLALSKLFKNKQLKKMTWVEKVKLSNEMFRVYAIPPLPPKLTLADIFEYLKCYTGITIFKARMP